MISRVGRGPALTAPALLSLGAVLDMTWIAEPLFSNGLSPTSAYLSQWEAAGVQYAQLWRGCFTTSDIAVLIAAVIVLRSRRRQPVGSGWMHTGGYGGAFWTLGWSALALFGAASAVSDLVPTDLSADLGAGLGAGDPVTLSQPLVDSGPLWARLLAVGFSMGVHGVSSIVSGSALIIAIGASTLAVRALNDPDTGRGTRPAAPSPALGRYGPGMFAVQLASSLALVAAIVLHLPAGVAGRLELSTEAGCLAFLAFCLRGGVVSAAVSAGRPARRRPGGDRTAQLPP